MRHAELSRRALLADEAGSAMLELALCGSLVLLVILGIMQCSLAVYTEHFVEAAASDALRYATVRGSTYSGTACVTTATYQCQASATDITNYIRGSVPPAVNAANLTVNATWPGLTGGGGVCNVTQGNNSPGCMVTVSVSYPFTFMLPAPLGKTITFSATRSTVISQ